MTGSPFDNGRPIDVRSTAVAPRIYTSDFSRMVGTDPVQIFASGEFRFAISYMRVWNVATAGGGTIWLCRSGSDAAPNTPGSFPLEPGQSETFALPRAIPTNGLSAISTAADTPLTVEVG